jgi:hypothetical protein
MELMMRRVLLAVLLLPVMLAGCQSPTDPDDTLDVDDILELSVTPNPAVASQATDGRTYRVVRGNNQPDEILPFDWFTSFVVTATLNDNANDSDIDLEFPIDLTSVSVAVKQASGGIVSPPSGGETEHYFHVTEASTNRYPTANNSVNIKLDVWYDLPSLRKEALITVSMNFQDADGQSFTKSYDVRVAP